MTKILDAKPWVVEHEQTLKTRLERFKKRYGRTPKLIVILVGTDPASQVYVKNKAKRAEKLGFLHETVFFKNTVLPATVREQITQFNLDKTVDGILLQRPLPSNFNENEVIYWISPEKDVDCFHPENIGKLVLGMPGLYSCTPSGVLKLLEFYKVPLEGAHACVVGRSSIVGKPMAQLLLQSNCTVTQVHRKTKDLKRHTREAEILIVAAGIPELIGKDHVQKDVVVVDIGIHRKDDLIVGDVKTQELMGIAKAITPVPGGVGLTTISMLLENTLFAAEIRETLASV